MQVSSGNFSGVNLTINALTSDEGAAIAGQLSDQLRYIDMAKNADVVMTTKFWKRLVDRDLKEHPAESWIDKLYQTTIEYFLGTPEAVIRPDEQATALTIDFEGISVKVEFGSSLHARESRVLRPGGSVDQPDLELAEQTHKQKRAPASHLV